MQELADQIGAPLVYLVDAAGARIDEQFDSYAGRHAWGNIFYNLVQYLRPGAPGVRPVRAVAGRLGVRARAVRPHDHGPGPRHRLPGLPPPGRDGDGRAGDAGGDGRRRDALPRLGPGRPARRERRGGHRRHPGVALVLPAVVAPAGADRRRPRRGPRPPDRRDRARARARSPSTWRSCRGRRRRGQLLPLQAAVRPRAGDGPGPPGRPTGGDPRQPVAREGGGAVHATRPTRRPGSSGSATPSTSRCCSWPTSRAT